MIEVIPNKTGTFILLCDTPEEIQQVWDWLLETFPSAESPRFPKNVGFYSAAHEECWPKIGRHVYFYDDNDILAFKLRWM